MNAEFKQKMIKVMSSFVDLAAELQVLTDEVGGPNKFEKLIEGDPELLKLSEKLTFLLNQKNIDENN